MKTFYHYRPHSDRLDYTTQSLTREAVCELAYMAVNKDQMALGSELAKRKIAGIEEAKKWEEEIEKGKKKDDGSCSVM